MAEHSLQPPFASLVCEPGGHWHVPSAIITRPDWAAHTHWEALVEPDCSVVLPSGQGAHTDAPRVPMKCPTEQDSHVVPATTVPFLHTQPSPTWTLLGSDTHTHFSTSVAPRAVVVVP